MQREERIVMSENLGRMERKMGKDFGPLRRYFVVD